MATMLLAAAGAAAGSAIGGSVMGISAAAIGQAIGASLGSAIDQSLLGPGDQSFERGKTDAMRIQQSGEGRAIPQIAGRMRVSGQVLWSSGFQETMTATSTGGGKFSGPKITTEQYSYSSSIAIGLCEGEVSKIGRIWANGDLVDRSTLSVTLYKGDHHQQPDDVIASYEGLERTPAFRGTAYVVIEDMELSAYGNRIPQLSFEVFRKLPEADATSDISRKVQAVCLIPGSGEFALSSQPVTKKDEFGGHIALNRNTDRGNTDFIHAIEDLQADLPNCKNASLVVSWFGSDLRCDQCLIEPKLEYRSAQTVGGEWGVAGLDRHTAKEVGRIDDRPAFGGTPSDHSVIEAIQHLRQQGIGVMYYPFILMDVMDENMLPDPWSDATSQPKLPWRGRITASIAPGRAGTPDRSQAMIGEVEAFFGSAVAADFSINEGRVSYHGPSEWGYRRFILHQAALCAAAGGVSAFCIGSEMRSLTQLRDAQNRFVAVEELRLLAGELRAILGPDVKLGYAADWSEYFGYQPSDGSGDVFFHLDPLWSDAEIDFIGIDNYMPLADWRDMQAHLDQSFGAVATVDYLRANIEGGEGYDWYYHSHTDRVAQTRTAISDGAYGEDWIYRYKDLRNWWQNHHHERVNGTRSSTPTDWIPQSKPIWFTEYGFPAVDKGANQPNVFVDPKSSESQLPYFSSGKQSLDQQRAAIEALLGYWAQNAPLSDQYHGPMIDLGHSYLWAWDTRPWPDFPLREMTWSDAQNYQLGHWVSGRMTDVSLPDLVAYICHRAGLEQVDVSNLSGRLSGCDLGGGTMRQSLDELAQMFQFSAIEENGILRFSHHDHEIAHQIDLSELVDRDDETLTLVRPQKQQELGRLNLGYVDEDDAYQFGYVQAISANPKDQGQVQLRVSHVMSRGVARTIASRLLSTHRANVLSCQCELPESIDQLRVGELINLIEDDGFAQPFRIAEIKEMGTKKITAIAYEGQSRAVDVTPDEEPHATSLLQPPAPVDAIWADLPEVLDGFGGLFAGVVGGKSRPIVFAGRSQIGDWGMLNQSREDAIIGRTITPLNAAEADRWAAQELVIRVSQNLLSSQTSDDVLAGKNRIAIRLPGAKDWEIIAFQSVQVTGEHLVLSRLLRGLRGTEYLIPQSYPAGCELVVLDHRISALPDDQSNESTRIRFGPAGQNIESDLFQERIVPRARAMLRPFAPAHLRVDMDGEIMRVDWRWRSPKLGAYWGELDVPKMPPDQNFRLTLYENGDEILRQDTRAQSAQIDLSQMNISGALTIGVAVFSDQYGLGPETRKVFNV